MVQVNVLILGPVSWADGEAKVMLKVGDSAPDFTVLTHEGQPLTLSAFRGHKVLLWFYPKADTPG
jgi:thioredoxin-dependent peroxiredoxin